jgi:hypothetical protein
MTRYFDGRTYFEIEIEANDPTTDIWLADDRGHLVQKEVGVLRSALLPGEYVVEFVLGSTCYPISLHEDRRFTQRDLQTGPTCVRPVPIFDDVADDSDLR